MVGRVDKLIALFDTTTERNGRRAWQLDQEGADSVGGDRDDQVLRCEDPLRRDRPLDKGTLIAELVLRPAACVDVPNCWRA